MLTITVPAKELYDAEKGEFVYTKEQTMNLEHSLVSISKWEAKWCKPFLDNKKQKTNDEMLDYVRCMTVTPNVNPYVYYALTEENLKQITEYIDAPMTATWFSDKEKRTNQKVMTSEIIYYMMIAFNIPAEYSKWHLNRLMTLIKICALENSPKKKMGKKELMSKNAALNKARRKALGSNG